jgi:hypothetical protein
MSGMFVPSRQPVVRCEAGKKGEQEKANDESDIRERERSHFHFLHRLGRISGGKECNERGEKGIDQSSDR